MYAYFGHHRCATMWTMAIIRALGRELGLRVAEESRYHQLPADLPQTGFFAHLNATDSVVQKLAGLEYRGFHVIRDPRDILVSSYFSDKYSHPVYGQQFAQFREQLGAVEFDQGMRLHEAGRHEHLARCGLHRVEQPRGAPAAFQDPSGSLGHQFTWVST